jgi:hypothetical protein
MLCYFLEIPAFVLNVPTNIDEPTTLQLSAIIKEVDNSLGLVIVKKGINIGEVDLQVVQLSVITMAIANCNSEMH